MIGLANWMPEGFGLDFFGPHADATPPPPGLAPPLRWGTEEGLRELLGGGPDVTAERRVFSEQFLSTDHAVEVFRAHFGPTIAAFAAVGPEGEEPLRDLKGSARRTTPPVTGPRGWSATTSRRSRSAADAIGPRFGPRVLARGRWAGPARRGSL